MTIEEHNLCNDEIDNGAGLFMRWWMLRCDVCYHEYVCIYVCICVDLLRDAA